MAPSGPWDCPAPSGITVPASQTCSYPMCSFFHPCPQASGPPGETCASTDSFPRCPWSRMRPGVSPEAHPLGCGRSQRGLTREGPAVGGEAVSPGDGQPHVPRPRAHSPPAERDGFSTQPPAEVCFLLSSPKRCDFTVCGAMVWSGTQTLVG